MVSMEAIIYAAGVGGRLKGRGQGLPKILLEFGGRSLLEWHVICLSQVGVERCTFVSGYRHELVREELDRIAARYPVTLRQIVNSDYSEGSVLSMHVSLPVIRSAGQRILLMDGDVLYPAAMLRRLLDSGHRTALLIDRDYSTADDDPVLVPVVGGRPVDFRKRWSGAADLVGESIGFFVLAPEDVDLLAAETLVRTVGDRRRDSYDDVLRALVMAGRFGYEDVTGLPWTEIDFPEDMDRAEQEVLPAIALLAGEKKREPDFSGSR